MLKGIVRRSASKRRAQCPLWVISRHMQRKTTCPLYTNSDRESRHAAKVMSARMLRQCNDVRAARKRRLLSIQIDEFFEYLKSIKLAVAQTAAPIRPKKVTKLSTLTRRIADPQSAV
jgi:hypothetical protein